MSTIKNDMVALSADDKNWDLHKKIAEKYNVPAVQGMDKALINKMDGVKWERTSYWSAFPPKGEAPHKWIIDVAIDGGFKSKIEQLESNGIESTDLASLLLAASDHKKIGLPPDLAFIVDWKFRDRLDPGWRHK